MNKAHLIKALADKLGDHQQAAEAVEAVLDTIVRAVVAGEHVSINGFGSFETAEVGPFNGYNFQTGERVRVKEHSVPRFRPAPEFEDLASGSTKLPRGGASAIRKAPHGGRQPAAAKAAARKTAGKKTAATRAVKKAPASTATTKTAASKATIASRTPEREAARKASRAAAEEKKRQAAAALKEMTPAKKTPAKKATAKKATRTRSA